MKSHAHVVAHPVLKQSGAIAVLGAGAWGTALAIAFARNGLDVRLWSWRSAHTELMQAERQNREGLPGFRFPPRLQATTSLARAVAVADIVALAAPSGATEALAEAAAPHAPAGAAAMICAKGLSKDGKLLSECVRPLWRAGAVLTLSGPSFADEVAQGLPTIVTLAGPETRAGEIAARLSSAVLVLCPSGDIVGVQLAGVFKNVAATLCGVSDGLGFGSNARAALMSEAMREAAELIAALGGRRETLLGPAGFGDFALTCTDSKSRNYSFGRQLAEGGAHGAIVTREGAANVAALLMLSKRAGVDAPLAAAVDDLLCERIGAREAVEAAFACRRGRTLEAARAA